MGRSFYRGLMVVVGFAASSVGAANRQNDQAPAESLIQNGSFEVAGADRAQAPEGWRFYTSKMGVPTLSTNVSKEGMNSFRLRAQSNGGAACGVVQTIAVTPGEKYSLTAWVRKNEDDPLKGAAYGQLVIEWQDETGKEIDRVWGKKWGPNTGHTKWDDVEISKAQAPPRTAQAIFGIHLFDGKTGGKGSVLVDEVSVTSP